VSGDILAQRLDEANSQSVANVIYALRGWCIIGGRLISEMVEPLKILMFPKSSIFMVFSIINHP